MKILLLFTFCLIIDSVQCQGLLDNYPSVTTLINQTDDNLNNFHKVNLENEEFMENVTDGGGTLTGYYSNNKIKKIELTVGLSYGVNKFQIYFRDSELLYILETFEQFDYNVDSNTFNYSKTETTFSGQYLFTSQFNYLTLGHNRFENDNLDPESTLRSEVTDYLKKLGERKNAP